MTEPSVSLAEARVAAARRQLGDTLGAIQVRLDPRTVARNAVDDIADGGEKALRSGADAVRRHPIKAAGAVALVAAVLARHRISALVARLRPPADPSTRDEAPQPASARRVRFARPRPAPARRDVS